MKLRDFVIENFDGGLVLDKSDLTMDRNEFKNTLNLDFDEKGRAKRRRGIMQFGDTKTGIIDESAAVSLLISNTVYFYHVMIDRASNATLYRIVGNYTTAAITAATTTITVGSTGMFAGSGSVEIEGDVIAYTGSTATTLTGCTGILGNHPAFTSVQQIISAGATGMNTVSGVYFAILNNLLFINGRAGSATWDGTTITAVSDADEPGGLFATNYRDRIYVAGSGVGDGSGTRNGAINRVSYSDAGDATSWTLTNYFDVEDERGEAITGLKENSDHLIIFKFNSIHTYNEVQLVQTMWNVGAYNHKVVRKIGNNMFTFCPAGVFITNGFSFKKISEPVDKYLRLFRPQYDTANRVVVNCFAGQFEGKYLLYLGDIPLDTGTVSDMVLVYDSQKNNWTVHDGYTDLTHFGSFKTWVEGTGYNAVTGARTAQFGESLFAGDGSGKYYRLFDSRYYDDEATRGLRGGDIIPNMISNSTGTPISTILETPFLPLGSLDLKKIGYITAVVEQGDFDVSYRLKTGNKTSDPVNLGSFKAGVTNKKLKQDLDECEFISLRVVSNTMDVIPILNALVVRDIETLTKVKYG